VSPDYDVIITGAGMAGIASALALAPEGYRILLLDREVFPRHKPCGEGLMPLGVSILESLGALPAILEGGAVQVHGLAFRSEAGVWARANFPSRDGETTYGLVMRRYDLDTLLLDQVRRWPNVTVREGFRVTGAIQEGQAICGVMGHPTGAPDRTESIRAPLTLGTDGPRSTFHNRYGVTRTMLGRTRLGVTGHLRGVEGLGPAIEVIHQRGYELYIAPANDGLTLVAILLDEEVLPAFEGNLVKGFHGFLRSVVGFGERIRESELVPPVMARGPLGYRVEPVVRPGLLLLGDSAGFLDPLTGVGMTQALLSVRAARPVVGEAFARGDFGEEALAPYARARGRAIEDVQRLTKLLLEVSRFSALSNRAIRRLSRDGALFQKLLGIVAGTQRYADISVGDRLKLLLG
jgi:2-polyprenyl-6-methoxyphenol hydroxylase-like FAD-dependent oxidoreductase